LCGATAADAEPSGAAAYFISQVESGLQQHVLHSAALVNAATWRVAALLTLQMWCVERKFGR
jgi:hypothetical protein